MDELDEAPLLLAERIFAGYVRGVDVLSGCGLLLSAGELVGVIGPNGAGKSTLVKAIFGLLRVRMGRVSFRGEDVTNQPAHKLVSKGIGYVPQRQNVFPTLTVEENLRMGTYLQPKEFARRAEVVRELFPVLAQRRNQKASSMSGGERQMLSMGRALMMEPDVLLLDEPSAGLSPRFQDQVFERVKEINATGVAILMVEQNARRCLQICDRGYVLDQGTNAYTGTGRELLHDEKVIELYLGTLARAR
ncbi:ABC transporter ATP-binding protein [Prauserella sp. PE36]|uniref:ABC transporter ATP-binding protein n=1 Tax=Prauserella endophytica TaxID=1592324 RepID=A0ABY2RZ78_9PSEU|nr:MULTISPECIES: ABC transporter ATP-binding protein [Prauserella]PXY26818.1 ABC transporter ATP-binding protein [Prauserella coralliicola]RBM15565.1 ABC transporter ATP-binding protein [Prauserella sp. PE36]TKG66240.1 ABC transporter ATP-binding protein [Prauserella endophytica]